MSLDKNSQYTGKKNYDASIGMKIVTYNIIILMNHINRDPRGR